MIPVLAHGYVVPGTVWTAWSFEPVTLAGIGAASVIYLVGAARMRAESDRRFPSRRRIISFCAGLVTIGIALISPLDRLGETLFSVHMAQHLLLLVVAPPLVVYGAPFRTSVLALPARARRPIHRFRSSRFSRALKRTAAGPIAVWTLYVGVLWAWHLPSLYQSAVTNRSVHALEHVAFLAGSLLFWSLLIQNGVRRRPSYGGGLLLVFITAMQSAALGAILLFAPDPLYPVYAPGARLWGLTPLEDQQIAGASMWVPMGMAYFATIVVLFVRWFKDIETRMRRKEGMLTPATVEKAP